MPRTAPNLSSRSLHWSTLLHSNCQSGWGCLVPRVLSLLFFSPDFLFCTPPWGSLRVETWPHLLRQDVPCLGVLPDKGDDAAHPTDGHLLASKQQAGSALQVPPPLLTFHTAPRGGQSQAAGAAPRAPGQTGCSPLSPSVLQLCSSGHWRPTATAEPTLSLPPAPQGASPL